VSHNRFNFLFSRLWRVLAERHFREISSFNLKHRRQQGPRRSSDEGLLHRTHLSGEHVAPYERTCPVVTTDHAPRLWLKTLLWTPAVVQPIASLPR